MSAPDGMRHPETEAEVLVLAPVVEALQSKASVTLSGLANRVVIDDEALAEKILLFQSPIHLADVLDSCSSSEQRAELASLVVDLRRLNLLVRPDSTNLDGFSATIRFLVETTRRKVSLAGRDAPAPSSVFVLDWIGMRSAFDVLDTQGLPWVYSTDVADAKLSGSDAIFLVAAGRLNAPLREFNRHAVTSGKSVLYLLLERNVLWLGPLVFPKETACLECLYYRRRANVFEKEIFDAEEKENSRATLSSTLLNTLAAALACAQLTKVMLGAEHLINLGQITRVDLVNLSFEAGDLLIDPRCSVCNV